MAVYQIWFFFIFIVLFEFVIIGKQQSINFQQEEVAGGKMLLC